jgi:hypothetical protein
MFDDLLELATNTVHPEHTPHISHPITSNNASGSSTMPRRARQLSASVSSAVAEVNGRPPALVPASKSPSPVAARHKRTRSTASQPGSPRALAQALTTRPHQDVVEAAPLKFVVAVLSNLVLSGVVRYALATYTSLGSGQLGAFSKNPEENPYTLAVIGWRIVTLAVYWFGGFDGTLKGISLILTRT